MSEPTRAELGETREELKRDRRWEYRLIAQAVVAIVIIAAIVVVREVFF